MGWILARLVAKDPRQCVRSKLLATILSRNPDLTPDVDIQAPPALRAALDRREGLLIVQVHEGLRSVSALLLREGREHARLGSNPGRYLRKLENAGFDTATAHVVSRDEVSLLALRDMIRRGLPVCCAVDFTAEGRRHGFISPAIFAFAMRFDVPAIFVKSLVTASGGIELRCRGPLMVADADQAARDFIDFFNTTGTTRAAFEVRPYRA